MLLIVCGSISIFWSLLSKWKESCMFSDLSSKTMNSKVLLSDFQIIVDLDKEEEYLREIYPERLERTHFGFFTMPTWRCQFTVLWLRFSITVGNSLETGFCSIFQTNFWYTFRERVYKWVRVSGKLCGSDFVTSGAHEFIETLSLIIFALYTCLILFMHRLKGKYQVDEK